MGDKKGFLFTIFLFLIIALLLLLGILYIKVRTSGLEFRKGNFLINIKYSPQEQLENSNFDIPSADEFRRDLAEENNTQNDLSLDTENFSVSYENLTNKSQ